MLLVYKMQHVKVWSVWVASENLHQCFPPLKKQCVSFFGAFLAPDRVNRRKHWSNMKHFQHQWSTFISRQKRKHFQYINNKPKGIFIYYFASADRMRLMWAQQTDGQGISTRAQTVELSFVPMFTFHMLSKCFCSPKCKVIWLVIGSAVPCAICSVCISRNKSWRFIMMLDS